MTHRIGRIARTLVAAALAAVAAVSCLNPIDRELLLRVDDGIAPDLAIAAPTAYSYYHGTMDVTGAVADSSSVPGDEEGRIRTFSFFVSDASLLSFTVTFDAAGNPTISTTDPSFDPSFSWDSGTGTFSFEVPTDTLQGYKVFSFTAADVNRNETRRDLALLPYPYGPHLVLTTPEDNSSYDMAVAIEGTVTDTSTDGTTDEVKALNWETNIGLAGELVIGPATQQPDGTYRAGTFSFDPATGAFSDWFDSSHRNGEIRVTVSAQNVSSVWSSAVVYLDYNGSGPAIVLEPAAFGHNPTEYSNDITTLVTIDGIVDVTNLQAGSVQYWVMQNPGSPRSGSITPDGVTGAFSFTFNPQASPTLSGNLTIQVKARDNRDIESTASYTCYDDTTPPAEPDVSGPASPTNDDTPTWTWNTPATTADFQYSTVGGLGPWTTTAATSYTPAAPLDDGTHSLWVRARDALGNASASDSYSLTVDTDPPSAPSVNAPASPTNDDTPTWSWNRPTGAVEFRTSLVSATGPWTTTAALSWTASPPLDPDDPFTDYTLYVQGRDAAGNWSQEGSDTVRVDTTPPPAPTVTGTASPTTDQTPTWTWNTPGDATGFRRSYNEVDWTTTGLNSFTPSSNLNTGTSYTVYVQARDAVGNWSASGSYAVYIEEP